MANEQSSKKTSIQIDANELDEYILDAKDASFFTGLSFFGSNNKNDPNYDDAAYLSFTLVPSPFPRRDYEYAMSIQKNLNYLIHAISNDFEFLHETLKSLVQCDEFVKRLWNLYKTVYEEGIRPKWSLCFVRSDYALDSIKRDKGLPTSLSQIEFNAFSVGGCATPTNLRNLHKYMLRKTGNPEFIAKMPEENLLEATVKSLITAWKLYGELNSQILLVVRDRKESLGDHRLIEYAAMEMEPRLRIKRVKLNELFKRTRLDESNKLYVDNDEIGLVYYKAGFIPTDYPTENEWTVRLMIERSVAIKASAIQHHLVTLKKIQQAMCEPGVIEKYIQDKGVADKLRATFVKLYSLEKTGENLINEMLENCENYVLKAQREGGGNNIFGKDIREFYDKLEDKSKLSAYTLMERIRFQSHESYMVRAKRPVVKQTLTTELGIFGIFIGDTSNNFLLNEVGGSSCLTKNIDSNEGGIMAGFGAYDTIYLADNF